MRTAENLEGLEVWVTECGAVHETAAPDYNHAAATARVLLTYTSEDVNPDTAIEESADMVFLYNLKNDSCGMGLMTAELEPYAAYGCYTTLESVLGTAFAEDSAAVVFTDYNTDPKRYCFVRPDGDLVVATWIENAMYNEAALTFTVQDPGYDNPVLVDLLTGTRTPLSSTHISRDAQGRVVVSSYPVSHKPVLLELDSLKLPHLYSVTPKACDQAAAITINDVSGSGFSAGTTVRLEMDANVFNATGITMVSSTRLSCNFDLTTAALGYYDVVVKNPDGQEARLVDAYGVAPAGAGCGTGTTTAAIMIFGMTLGLISVRELGRHGRGSDRNS